jgi:altronate hydrolase
MKYCRLYSGEKLSRRNFISMSSLGITFGMSEIARINQTNQLGTNNNHMNNVIDGNTNLIKSRVLQLHPKDNVAVALENLSKGTEVSVNSKSLILGSNVSAKHKFALSDIASGETIYMYGIKVGTVVKPIAKGTAITTENITNAISEVKRNNPRNFRWSPPSVDTFRNRSFLGYHRPDGKVGTANYWIVVPMVFCENRNVEVIKEAVLAELGYQHLSPYNYFVEELISTLKKGASIDDVRISDQAKNRIDTSDTRLFSNVTGIQFLTHSGGCGESRQDSEELCGILAGYITHPNVAGATVISLGCQNAQLSVLQEQIRKRDANFSKPYYEFDQQKIGSEDEMIKQAIQSIFKGLIEANKIERKPAPLSKLCIGVECGGSDGFSGISANPAVGHVSDLIVALGGSVILSEFPELSGVEQDLYDRCKNQADAEKFLDIMKKYNLRAKSVGSGFDMNPSPGNIKDGLITDAMKSAGAAKKGGTAQVSSVLDYPEKIAGNGLHLLCSPGNDVESVTAEVGSGATLVLFTTGLGTPTGNPVVPVIKISTNTILTEKMSDIIDIDTGSIISGDESIELAAERILNYAIEVASGTKEPASLRNGQTDFIPWRRGVSL